MPPPDRPLDGLLGRLVPAAREAFLALPGAGAFPPGTPGVVTGEAGGTGHDAWIRLHLQLRDGWVAAARFQALGCPHTLAVAAAVTARTVGRPADDPVPGRPADWAAEFGVPVEKLGRLLLVEDALTACVSRLVPRP